MKKTGIFEASVKLIQELGEKLLWVEQTENCSVHIMEFIDVIALYNQRFHDDVLNIKTKEFFAGFNQRDFVMILNISNFLNDQRFKQIKEVLLHKGEKKLRRSIAFAAVDLNMLIKEEYEVLCKLL